MLSASVRRQLIQDYQAAESPSDAGEVIAKYAASTGVSKGTLYRILRQVGIKTKRISEGGRPRITTVTSVQIEEIAKIIYQTKKQAGYIRIDYEGAISVAERAGIIPAGNLTIAQLKYYLDKEGLLKRDLLRPTPTIPRRSDYPNQVHLFDWSVCAQYHFPKDGRIGGSNLEFVHWSQSSDPNKLIPQLSDRKYHLWRGLVVDHYTHAFYVQYFLIKGESALSTIEFLENAWFRHPEEAVVFHGLPERLICDKGPGNTSDIFGNLCATFGITLIMHATGHPWAKGSVEQCHGLIERKFESQLRFDPARNLDQLNRRAHDWMIKFQTVNIHTRYLKPRYHFWNLHLTGHLRVPPDRESFRNAAVSKPQTRKVSQHGTISVDGVKHLLPETFRKLVDKKITIYRNPFNAPNLTIGYEGEFGLAKPVTKDKAGFLSTARSILNTRAAPPDQAEKLRQRADDETPVHAPIEKLSEMERLKHTWMYTQNVADVQQPVAAIPEPKYSIDDARARIINAIPGMPHEIKQLLRSEIKQPVTGREIRALIENYETLINENQQKQQSAKSA